MISATARRRGWRLRPWFTRTKRKWGRHCCRPHYRLRRFRTNDWSPDPCLTACVAAVMLIEQPRVQWAPGVLRIVMLVASGLIGSGLRLHAIIALFKQFSPHPSCDICEPASFGQFDCTDVWSRQAVGSCPEGLLPSTWRFQSAVPKLSHEGFTSGTQPWRTALPSGFLRVLLFSPFQVLRPFRGFPCAPSGHLEPTDSLAPLAASAVRAGSLRRACQACFSTLLRASLPSRSG
jgi:hypothetical protein